MATLTPEERIALEIKMNAGYAAVRNLPQGFMQTQQSPTPAAQKLGAGAVSGAINDGSISVDKVRANGQAAGLNPATQFGSNPVAGLYTPKPKPKPVAKPVAAPVKAGPQPVVAPPMSNPLPSSTSLGSQANGYTKPAPIDYAGLRKRAANDSNLQVQGLRDQALQNVNRFKSEGGSQIDMLKAMYAGSYQDNALNTDNAARSAVQDSANRGFFSSGLSTDADMRAKLAGEQERMRMQGQENAQVGEIQNRVNLSGQEFNDMLQQLAGKEGQLTQSLADQYAQTDRNFDLQNRGLSSDIALKLMGMDQSYNQFNQGLAWDQNKFGQQLQQSGSQFDRSLQFDQQGRQLEYGDRNAQRQWQSGEANAGRTWQGQQDQTQRNWQTGEAAAGRNWQSGENTADRTQQVKQAEADRTWRGQQSQLDRQQQVEMSKLDHSQRTQLQQMSQSWQAGQASLDRGSAMERQSIENGLKNTWWEAEMKQKVDFRKEDNQQATDQWNAHYMQTVDGYINDARSSGAQGPWSTYDGAVRELNRVAPRMISEGAQPSLVMEYMKRKYELTPTIRTGGGGR